jgi:23S rRNA (guanosine2251-2'-O)-methyltransferase
MPTMYMIADNIRSLYNVGALFRLCDAVGVEKLYLCGITPTPVDTLRNTRQRQHIAKTALAALDVVPWEYHPSAISLVSELRAGGIQVVALEQTPTSVHYRSVSYASPIAIVLGHERDGVTHDLLRFADASVEIPMMGVGQSLNVISAASVLAFEVQRQWQA